MTSSSTASTASRGSAAGGLPAPSTSSPTSPATGYNERELQRALLDEVGVATLAGSTFGPHGAGHIRLSYANSVDNIERALDRIALHLGAGAVTPA